MPSVKSTLPVRFRALRQERGLTQEQVAERAQRSHDTVSNLERGAALPTLETLEALAAAIGVEIGDLFATRTKDVTAERAELEGKVILFARTLSDADLRVAVEQLAALARRRD